ncbi:alpha-amylase family glycosyl hydrolase [Nitrospira sp. Ecomares 2.1]
MRFWLARGVDGFRIDALDLLLKDEQFRDNPPNPEYADGQGPDSQLLPHHTRDQNGIHEIVATIRRSRMSSVTTRCWLVNCICPCLKRQPTTETIHESCIYP